MNETIWQPLILSVAVEPNPATAGESVLFTVVTVDVFGAEQAEARLCGEFLCGEV